MGEELLDRFMGIKGHAPVKLRRKQGRGNKAKRGGTVGIGSCSSSRKKKESASESKSEVDEPFFLLRHRPAAILSSHNSSCSGGRQD